MKIFNRFYAAMFFTITLFVCFSANAYEAKNYSQAGKILLKDVYTDDLHNRTFYCKCKFDKDKNIDLQECGYKMRVDNPQRKRLSWEHIVPASRLGNKLTCWKTGHSNCSKKGRKCCQKVSPRYQQMDADMHNLVPSINEINVDRSNFVFKDIVGEARAYGKCDFEVKNRTAEAEEGVRGDIARTYLYMNDRYNLGLTNSEITEFKKWNQKDPVSDWEKTRNRKIHAIQGNSNHFIENLD